MDEKELEEKDIQPADAAGEAAPEGETAAKPPRNAKKELIEWVKAFVFAGIIVALIFGFVIRPVEVLGHSMEPTLQNGDRLIEWMLFYTPQQGDTVILSENTGLDEALVKRVIAVEGQTVDINENGEVLVDGSLLDEPYIYEAMRQPMGETLTDVVVPEGSIFVMGDNRNNSSDSRDVTLGTVDERYVLGRALWVILPFQRFGPITHGVET